MAAAYPVFFMFPSENERLATAQFFSFQITDAVSAGDFIWVRTFFRIDSVVFFEFSSFFSMEEKDS